MVSAYQIRYFLPYYRGHTNIVRSLRVFRDDYVAQLQQAIPYLPLGSRCLHVVHVRADDAMFVYIGVVTEPYGPFAGHRFLVDAAETQVDNISQCSPSPTTVIQSHVWWWAGAPQAGRPERWPRPAQAAVTQATT